MKIALIAPSGVPFVIGGAEKLWWGMLHAFNQSGQHQVELIKLPSPEHDFWSLIQSYQQYTRLDLRHFDLVISTKYPAWMIHHPNHIVYLQHTLRGLYDTYPAHLDAQKKHWPSAFTPLLDWMRTHPPGQLTTAQLAPFFQQLDDLKRHPKAEQWQAHLHLPSAFCQALIHYLDQVALHPSQIKRYYAISKTVAQRKNYFPQGADITVLPHPSDLDIHPVDPGQLNTAQPDQGYLFTASRLDAPKRIDLIIEAFAQSQIPRPLLIAGTGPEQARLEKRIQQLGLQQRITLLGYVANDQLIRYYQQAWLIIFTPRDEDMGLITLEAMKAAKPVLSTDDAGGVTDFIRHQHNGWITPATPQALAQALRTLHQDPDLCRQLAQQGYQTAQTITWQNVEHHLLSAPAQPAAKPRLLVLNTFSCLPPNSGGKVRMYHLYQALSQSYQVTQLVLDEGISQPTHYHINDSFQQISLPPSKASRKTAHRLSQHLGVSAFDLAVMAHPEQNPDYAHHLSRLLAQADKIVCAHCYLFPLLQSVWRGWQYQAPKPQLIYDAHNVEYDLKAAMLPPQGQAMLQQLDQTERQLVNHADQIWVCADQDAQRLQQRYQPQGQLILVPNGVSLNPAPHKTPEQKARMKKALGLNPKHLHAVFIGSYHQPNIQALHALLDIAPTLPTTQFHILGSVCQALDTAAPLPNNIHLYATQTEARKNYLLSALDLGLNPVTDGSGTNLKIVDYINHGLLVLTTPQGNRGLAFQPDRHLIERPLDQFAHFLADYSPAQRQQHQPLCEAAYHLLAQTYDWQHIAHSCKVKAL